MKIVIAPQAFKGGLRGIEVARAMEEGVRRVYPEAETFLVPVADGGDGTLDVLVEANTLSPLMGESQRGGGTIPPTEVGGYHSGSEPPTLVWGQVARDPSPRYFETQVTGPLGEPVLATWGIMRDGLTAVIEMARASGLALVPETRQDPRTATTHGTGELIRAALDAGYREIIVGLGGSATNDGGVGIACALGARFTDASGADIPPGGAALASLDHIDLTDLDPRLARCRIRAATDVNNPLSGPDGASAVYGPQKGATPAMVMELDAALTHYASVLRRDVGIDVRSLPRAGGAGGAGAGLVALLGAELDSGGDIVCDAVRLDERMAGADLVITGEGRLDGQTVYDKAPIVVARRTGRLGVPVVAVAGSLGPGHEAVLEHGIAAVEAAALPGMTLQEALARAYELVRDAAERVVRRT